MGDRDNTWHVWRDLDRLEKDLRGGNGFGTGQQYDSMGRPAKPYSTGWGDEQMGRVARVRQALGDSGPIAQRQMRDKFTGIDLSSIWHILVKACEDIAIVYGSSVTAGGLIGGIGGAFIGGVGAFPGAAAGAAAGSYIGGAVLALLGLKSLIEEANVAMPEAVVYYKKGFIEAWGPTKRDHEGLGTSFGGNTRSAASDFASGHVIMIAAVLTAIVAYLTRGRGDKAVLLNEIGRSSRLGPRVAKWVAENEDRLRKHPALQSRRRAAAIAEPPSPPKRKHDPEEDGNKPKKMPRKDVPCFNTNDLPESKYKEFDRQLLGQEKGLNEMTVDEYLTGREAFDNGKSVRDPNVARRARAKYQKDIKNKLFKDLFTGGMSRKEALAAAGQLATEKMKVLAALHNPDMVAAGKDIISDFGDSNINSRLGAQWNKGERLAQLDKAALAIPESMRNVKMNIKLERCNKGQGHG